MAVLSRPSNSSSLAPSSMFRLASGGVLLPGASYW
jgi:hypothetical protein